MLISLCLAVGYRKHFQLTWEGKSKPNDTTGEGHANPLLFILLFFVSHAHSCSLNALLTLHQQAKLRANITFNVSQHQTNCFNPNIICH